MNLNSFNNYLSINEFHNIFKRKSIVEYILPNVLEYENKLFIEKKIIDEKDNLVKYFKNEKSEIDNYLNEKYPVLAEIIQKFNTNIDNYLIKILTFLFTQQNKINSTFGIDILKDLHRIEQFKGDLHNGNQSTSFLLLNNRKKLVLKPRCINNEMEFNNFCINYGIFGYMPKYFSSNDISIIEFIESEELNSVKSVKEYYFSMGKLLGISYLQNSEDFLAENFLIKQNKPILIDSECLFGNSFYTNKSSFLDFLSQSVIRSSILPQYYQTNGNLLTSPLVKFYKNFNKHVDNTLLNYLPVYNKKNIEVHDYLPEFLSGFEQTYKKLPKIYNKDIKNILEINVKYRILLRHTSFYFNVIQDSLLPVYLADHKSRVKLIKKALESKKHEWINNNKRHKIQNFEEIALKELDIPIFHIDVHDKNIYTQSIIVEKNVFESNTVNLIESKINKLTYSDLEYQKLFITETINNCLGLNQMYGKIFNNINYTLIDDSLKEIVKNILLKKVIVQDNFRFELLGITIDNNNKSDFNYNILSTNLYDGTAGILLSLINMGYKHDNFVRFIILQCIDRILSKKYQYISIFYLPFSGLLFKQYCIDNNISEYNKYEELIFDYIEEKMNNDFFVDFLLGSSSIIYFLLLNKFEIKNIDVIIQKYLKLLKSKIVEVDSKICFHIADNIDNNKIIGLCHGNIGFMLALNQIYIKNKEKTIFELLEKTFAYVFECCDFKNDIVFSTMEKNIIPSCSYNHGIAPILILFNQSKILFNKNKSTLLLGLIKNQILNSFNKTDFTLSNGMIGNLICLENYHTIVGISPEEVTLIKKSINLKDYFFSPKYQSTNLHYGLYNGISGFLHLGKEKKYINIYDFKLNN